jgi:MOSC domain-containing protein YiiM
VQVISTNIGQKTIVKWRGKDVETGIYKYPIHETIHLGITDVANDNVIDRRYHGGSDKACYLYSANHYAGWQEKLPNLNWQWGMFGENITVEDLDEPKIHIGDIYKLGTSLVQITQPRQPCFKLGIRLNSPKSVKLFVATEKPGAYVRVLKTGEVKPGDTMELIECKSHNFTLQQVFHLIYHAPENIDTVSLAIRMPELAESCRKDLIKYSKIRE